VGKILNLYRKGKISEATIIKMASFKEELISFLNEEPLEKNAFGSKIDTTQKGLKLVYPTVKKSLLGNTAKRILATAAIYPTLALSTYMIGKGMQSASDAAQEFELKNAFKKMMEYHPQLNTEDPLLVKKYWDSLAKFAPAIASEPLAAGAFIKQALQYEEGIGGPPFPQIEALIKAQKTYKETHPLNKENLGEQVLTGSRGAKLFTFGNSVSDD
jgi:hypothetical protein